MAIRKGRAVHYNNEQRTKGEGGGGWMMTCKDVQGSFKGAIREIHHLQIEGIKKMAT